MSRNPDHSVRNVGTSLKSLILLLGIAVLPGVQAANDYPTIERVEYVLGCARDMKKPTHEAIYKCSCVIDAIAERMPYDEFVDYSTATNAFSIGGERGETMRAYTAGADKRRQFRAIQAEARKACFLE